MAATVLLSTSITTAASAQVGSSFAGFSAAQAMTIQAKFSYVASAATGLDAWVQTSLDGGLTWIDVAEFNFTTASATKVANVVALTAVPVPVAVTDGSMAANTTLQGVIGDLWRVKYTSVGTYGAGTTLVVTVQPR